MNGRSPPSEQADEPHRRKNGRTLAEAAVGHDNNLNLLRVLAALLVLASHSVTLATGRASDEPGRGLLGLSLGDVAVDIFFVISGFLVTGSLTRSNSLRKYVAARGLRIVPGLWVALFLTVLAISLGFSAYSPVQNLLDLRTWHYLVRNALIVTGMDFSLPGAFASNPFPGSVNASLWTLPLEVWMYILLAMEWWASSRLLERFGRDYLQKMLPATAIVLLALTLGFALHGRPSNSLRHAAMFFSAAWIYLIRARIPLRLEAAIATLATIMGATLVSHDAFEVVYRLLFPYLVLYIAYAPAGFLRLYNKAGDFSYGIYIYAFPLQQISAAIFPGIEAFELMLVATVMTIVAAMFSWYLVESPSLRLRARIERRPA